MSTVTDNGSTDRYRRRTVVDSTDGASAAAHAAADRLSALTAQVGTRVGRYNNYGK